jgi:hypothetical protein
MTVSIVSVPPAVVEEHEISGERGGEDGTDRILVALTARMEQLESQCEGHAAMITTTGRNGPSLLGTNNPFYDDSNMSTVSLLTLDEFSVGSDNNDADTIASREHIAKLRKSKRAAEQEGTKKLHKSRGMLNRMCQENERLNAQQAEWEKERQDYQRAIKDMSVLVRSLQKALTTTQTDITASSASDSSKAEEKKKKKAPLVVTTVVTKEVVDEEESEQEDYLTPEAALEMTLKKTKVTIERLDEECQELEKSAETKQDQLETTIRGQRDMILQLQEDSELQTIKIHTLRDIVQSFRDAAASHGNEISYCCSCQEVFPNQQQQ